MQPTLRRQFGLVWCYLGIMWGVVWPSDGAEPVQSISLNPRGSGGFSLIESTASGIRFTNLLAQQRHLTNQILLNGSGVACGDIDGDGKVDIFFCGLDSPNALFRNLGDWKFENIAERAGVAMPNVDCFGAAMADIDGDGDLDLLVSTLNSGTRVFSNDGRGNFRDSPHGVLNGRSAGMSMALADLDGDGTLDLYIANYRDVTLRDQPNTRFSVRMVDGAPQVSTIDGRPLTDPHLTNRFTFKFRLAEGRGTFIPEENGQPDSLYLNRGNGQFTQVPFVGSRFRDEDGQPLTASPFDWGLSVVMRDLDGDGLPDIYVCNDFKSPDRIWINQGAAKFRAISRNAIRQTSLSSMGVDVADINYDGQWDIFVLDMLSRDHQRRQTQKPDINPELAPIGDIDMRIQTARNTLLIGRKDGTFAELAQFAGVQAAEWAWTAMFLDVDLDGYEDLLVSNGFERDGMNVDTLRQLEALKSSRNLPAAEQLALRRLFPRLDTPNAAFRNLGNLRFADVSDDWRFNAPGVSQGMALADLDNDGDCDVVINNMNGAALVYRNDTAAPRVAVRLKGLAPNTRGIGALIKVTGGPVPQMQEMVCGGRYLSTDDPIRVFAAGSISNRLRIEVTWRSGKRSVVENARPNTLYEIEERESAGPISRAPESTPVALFEDATSLLDGHQHAEQGFDDFARQPLLPNKLSQLGPGITWFDLDNDGFDDLIIGSGRGGKMSVFRNNRQGGGLVREDLSTPVFADQSTILGYRLNSGEAAVLAGTLDVEGNPPAGTIAHYTFGPGTPAAPVQLPTFAAGAGPMAMADLDGDGRLDLFVGGRVIPGRYPEPASSALWKPTAAGFEPDLENTRALTNVGLVSAAVFSDIDADGVPDLLLACEWGPIKVFRNQSGKLVEVTRELGLDRYVGWWNGIAAGDFDGDGRMDIVASNWGENTRYEVHRARPLRLYYHDFNGDGSIEIIESYFDPHSGHYVPMRNHDAFLRALPGLRARLPNWESFSKASVQDLFGDAAGAVQVIEANWLATTVFLNRGTRFEARRLPDEAQWAPAFGISITDFNGDGHEDIFLAQNFFATNPDASRYDAGRGLLLEGDGHGEFAAVPGDLSGIIIYGEQRGAATADFDGDGRMDLAVAQNGAATRLFRNRTGKPGVRIRLMGPAGNTDAMGAVVRIGSGTSLGPAREWQSGSGYWSQDSAVKVFAIPTNGTVQVRWPGGKTTSTEVPANAREIAVETSGRVRVVR